MSIIVPSYAYTYIKISFLKQILIDEETKLRLNEATKIDEFIDLIRPFYPGLSLKEYTIEEIENALTDIYIKIIGKIIEYSPQKLRNFLRDFLLKYEIGNIKNFIHGSILGLSAREKKQRVNFTVEKYLENVEFFNELIPIGSLDEIQLKFKNTLYREAIREGILYFKNNNETFVLDAFLDQLYYNNLIEGTKDYKESNKRIIEFYIKSMAEIYNLNMIYRGIKNDIDKKLLKQFLVDAYLIFTKEDLLKLLELSDVNDFILELKDYFNSSEEMKHSYKMVGLNEEHLHWSLKGLYQKYFFEKFEQKLEKIDYNTVYMILEIIMKKEKEIHFTVLPSIIKIIHQKYYLLENRE